MNSSHKFSIENSKQRKRVQEHARLQGHKLSLDTSISLIDELNYARCVV
jgi:division protein CdvB (Snf7/Vps24/ESCRT-III family)